jgi:hypothetical protein
MGNPIGLMPGPKNSVFHKKNPANFSTMGEAQCGIAMNDYY